MAVKQIIAVCGTSGMLGSQVYKIFKAHPGYVVVSWDANLSMEHLRPSIVINCVGITERHPDYSDIQKVYHANAVLPHRLHAECRKYGARLIHISTDCVFLGDRGYYREGDTPSPFSNYGISKLLGEIDAPDALTVRTSLIGHELNGNKRGLLEWFLSQRDLVTGYSRSFFSGLTTCEFAKVLRDYIVPNPILFGVLHIGGERISKYDLLRQIHTTYGLTVTVAQGQGPDIDRSLNSRKMYVLTRYKAPSWATMIQEMHDDRG